MNRCFNGLTLATCAVMCLAVQASAVAGGNVVRLEGRLTQTPADPFAEGQAKFEMRADRARASVEVQVTLAAAVEIEVNGVPVAVVPVNALGIADWNVDSRDGDGVPPLAAGDVIDVFDADDGTLLLSGRLSSK